MVDWCSGLTSRLGLWLGGGAAGSIRRSAFVLCGGKNACVYSLCMGVGVRTAFLAITQLGSVTEGFKLCWKTGQKAHLETILFTLLDLNITCSYSTSLVFELITSLFLKILSTL